jgi:outer membrane protein OmpA-like peptidoglycan-associated protein
MSFKNLIAAVAIAALAACGAHRPPQELVDARVAYATASEGNAAKLVPAELHDAENALNRAEREFDDDDDSQKTKDLAYIALRKAQRAEALGNAAAAVAAKSSMDQTVSKTQEAIIENQEGALRSREEALAKKQAELQNQRTMTEAERQKAMQAEAARLDAEAGKAAAEKKAQDAMDALSRSLAVKNDARGTVITLSGGVLFATNKAEILPGAQAQLNQVADALKAQAEQKITIEGHTDNTGTDAVNRDLSARRATAVRDYLIVRGVSANAISVLGSGSSRPVADNKSTEGRAMNRRVEIIVAPSTESAQR